MAEQSQNQELLAYNGMLSVFSLLANSRARITANVEAIEAKRDFWLAVADLGQPFFDAPSTRSAYRDRQAR